MPNHRLLYFLLLNTSLFAQVITTIAGGVFRFPREPIAATQAPLTLANGFPLLNLTPITTFAVDPNFRIGYAQSWQTAVQQTLPWGLVATVTYSGAKGTHQAQEFIPNSAPSGV